MDALNPDTPIPFVTVTNWVRSAVLCGFNIEPLFKAVGVDTTRLHPEQANIGVRALVALMEHCVKAARRQPVPHHFPVVLGESFAFDYLSDVETFITTSATLREATPALQWLPPLINPFMHLALQEHGDQARLVLHFTHPEASPRDTWHVAESVLITFCKFARLLLGNAWRDTAITLQHEAQEGDDAFCAAAGMPVRFGQALNALWFPRSLLDHPLRGALPALHQSAAQRVAAQVAQRAATSRGQGDGAREAGLTRAVTALLHQHPHLLGQGLDALAHHLHLHPRTLQRRLREEGTQHSALVAEVRRELACRWLPDAALSIEDISERLGFADRRSFTQAFSRWTGQTPSQFRTQGKP